jgi:hypothetical protein
MPSWFHRKGKSKSNATPPETPPALQPEELAKRLEALEVASKRTSAIVPRSNHGGTKPFVGGFATASAPSVASQPKVPSPPAFPIPSAAPTGIGGFHLPAPAPNASIPMPMPAAQLQLEDIPPGRTSMTMQHALAGLYTPPQTRPSADLRPPVVHPRPQSDPVLSSRPAFPTPAAQASPPRTPTRPALNPPALHTRPHSDSKVKPVSASTGPPLATPTPPKRRRNSTPSSPTASVAGGNGAVQCSGQTKAGKRCTRQVKLPASLAQIDDDNDGEAVERYCFQHSKELVGLLCIFAVSGVF